MKIQGCPAQSTTLQRFKRLGEMKVTHGLRRFETKTNADIKC